MQNLSFFSFELLLDLKFILLEKLELVLEGVYFLLELFHRFLVLLLLLLKPSLPYLYLCGSQRFCLSKNCLEIKTLWAFCAYCAFCSKMRSARLLTHSSLKLMRDAFNLLLINFKCFLILLFRF